MRKTLALTLALWSGQAIAQSAIENHPWQDPSPLVPLGHAAQAITGPVRVTARTISFNGKPVLAKLKGVYWRIWGMDGKNHSASVYELDSDPGKLRQGNTLCGCTDKARYVVLWTAHDDLTGAAVNMAVWSSDMPPQDKDSPGLCGTFSYLWKAR